MSGGSRRLAQDPMVRLNKRLSDLESKVGRLGRSPRLPQSSQRGGSQKLLAPDGTILFEFGDYIDTDDEERYGVVLYDGNGNIVLGTDEAATGLLWPGDNQQWGITAPIAVTSGAFADYWSSSSVALNSDALYATGVFTAPAGHTGEIRFRYSGWQGATPISGYTNTVAFAYTTSGSFAWSLKWLHPFNVGLVPAAEFESNVVTVWLEIRRTAGAGDISVYRPRMLWNGNSSLLGAPSASVPLTVTEG